MKSIKERGTNWISDRFQVMYLDSEKKSIKNQYHYYKIEDFCDEPEIFFVVTKDGLEWGYDGFSWDHPAIPTPTKRITRKLSWELLNSLNPEERREKIIDSMIKAINSKKREYRRCQLCNKKMHSNEFYDSNTCSVCAEKHLGIYVVY